MFSYGQRLGAVTTIVAISAVGLAGMVTPVMAASSVAATSLTLEQDRADLLGKIDARQSHLNSLSASVMHTAFITPARRDAMVLGLADSVANLGILRLDVRRATTVDQIEADRAKMTGYRINQVVLPRGVFVVRGQRMAQRMSASAASLRAARSRTNSAADLQLSRAATQLDLVASNCVQAVTAAYRVTPRSAVEGRTPFASANTSWSKALAALSKARSYLDAAQKADRTAPADTVIRAAESKPSTPINDRP